MINEWLFKIDLNVLVWKDSLTFDKKCAYLWLSNDVPPVFAILYHILDHFIIITLKLIIFLICEKSQVFDAIVDRENFEIFIYLLKHLLYLQNFFNVDFDVLWATCCIFSIFAWFMFLVMFWALMFVAIVFVLCFLR